MSLLGKIKKTIASDLADARDFGTKSLSGGYDVISSIIDRPAKYTLSGAQNAIDSLGYIGRHTTGALTNLVADPRYEGLDSNGNPSYSSKFEFGMPSLDTLSHLSRRNRDWMAAYNDVHPGSDMGKKKNPSSLRDYLNLGVSGLGTAHDLSNFGASTFQNSENVNPFFKTAAPIVLDPTTWVPVGSVGKIGAKVGLNPKLSPAASKLLGVNGAKATSRTARVLGGLAEGVGPKAALPFAAATGLGATIDKEMGINDPYGIVPMLTGGIGLAATGRLERYGNANRKAGPKSRIAPEDVIGKEAKMSGAGAIANEMFPSPNPLAPHGPSYETTRPNPTGVRFTTDKGSEYVFDNGITVRNKSPHQGHPATDVGIQQPSAKTVFVDPEDAKKVGMWNSLSSKGKSIVIQGENLLLTSINPKTGERGLDEKLKIMSHEPQIGLHPVELFQPDAQPGFFRGNHPGNKIDSIVRSTEPSANQPFTDWSRPRNPESPNINPELAGPIAPPRDVFNSPEGEAVGNAVARQPGLPGQSKPVTGGPIEPVTNAGKGPRAKPFTAASEQEQALRQDAQMRNQGIPETLGQQLNRIAWQHDDPMLTAKINAEEAHRRGALKRNTVGFRRPVDTPVGNLRARADEMLASLPQSELDKVMDPHQAIDKIFEFARYSSADEIANARSARQIQFEEGLVKGLEKNPPVPVEPGIGGGAGGGPRVKNYDAAMVESRAHARQMDIENGTDSFVTTPAANPAVAQRTITEEIGVRDPVGGTRELPDVTNFDDVVATIDSANEGTIYKIPRNAPIIRQILKPIYAVTNSGMNVANTIVGKGIIARQIQRTEIEQKTNRVLATLDSMSGFTGLRDIIGKHGSIFKTDKNGIIQHGINEHWNKVFSNPEKYTDVLSDNQKKFITQFNKIISDANDLLVANGFEPITKSVLDELWIPRVVKGIDGIEVIKPTNHRLDRFWEDATEGVQKGGIDYADPREVAKLYVYGVYKQIADQRFANFMAKNTPAVEKFVDPRVRARVAAAIDTHDATIAGLKEARNALKADPMNADLKKIFGDQVLKAKESKANINTVMAAFQVEMERVKSQEYRKVFVNGGEFGFPVGTKVPVDTFFVPAMKGLKDETGLKLTGERIVTRPDAKLLREYVGVGGVIPKERESLISKGLGAYGSSVRLASATFDAATPFNQNLVLLGSPITQKGWVKATVNQYRAMMSPRYVSSYITKNRAIIDEMINAGVDVGSNEFFDALARGSTVNNIYKSTVGKVPLVSTGIEQVGKNTVGRLEAAMSMALISGRVETYKAWKPLFEDNHHALGKLVNNMTGSLDLRKMMISKSQRDIESSFVGFSPRLMRSGMALIGMAMKPTTKEGFAAASTLAGLAGTASAMFFLGNLAMGNSIEDARDAIDPTSGKKYMALKTPTGYVGIGGFHRALVQFMANTQSAIHHGSSEKFATWDATENPFLQFYIGRGAPAVALAQNTIEATTGVNANPYEDANGWKGFLRTEGNSFLPMIVQSMSKNDSGGRDLESFVDNMTSIEGMITNPLNFNGLRTTPFSRSEERDVRIQNIGFMKSDGTPAKTIDELNKAQKEQFYRIYPVDKITKEDNVTKMYSRIKEEEDRYVLDLNTVAGTVTNKQDFKEYYKKRTAEKFAAIDTIKRDFSTLPADRPGHTGSVTDYINSRNTTPEDKAVSDYYDISHKVPLLASGQVDFDGIAKAKQDFLQGLDANHRAYVQKMTTPSQHISDNELVTEYDLVKKAVQPYFDAAETVFNGLRNKSPFLAQFGSYKALKSWEEKTAASLGLDAATVQSLLSSKIKDYKTYNNVLSNYKKAMRLVDPTLDVMLADWYGIRPANEFNYINVQHGAAPSTQYAQEIYDNPKLNSSANAYKYASSLPSMGLDANPARRPLYSLR